MKDYYQILGVTKDATQEEIKRAYRKLAHQYHPDKGGDEKKFKEINEAYQVLGNKEKRAQYDRLGQAFEGAGGAAPGDFDFSWSWGEPDRDFEFSFDDLGQMVEEMFGFGRPSKKRDLKRGRDIEIEMEISLEDTLKDKVEQITLEKMVVCSRCQGLGAEPGTKLNECVTCRGTGQVQEIKRTFFGSFTRFTLCPECKGEGQRPEEPCHVCRGEGRVKSREDIQLFIPAGVDTNQIIRIKGKGDAGRKGGKPGDLYLKIRVKKHPFFERKGDDLFISWPVSFSQLVLGDEIEVPTLDRKKILLKIPAGTPTGKILRVANKGVPHFGGWGRGDMYVKLVLKIPKKLTRRQKELLEKLKSENI